MIARIKYTTVAGLIFIILFTHIQAQAGTVEYELSIAQQEVNITGKSTRGMTINGTIPGPTLRFQEGDVARIHVHNKMSVETSIHWHGVLVPPDMDGVPYVSFPPIEPGMTFTYEFPIRQSGTYWYHSHTSLQEQRGVYGSMVIEPRQKGIQTDRDYVVLFSDWTDENLHEVLRTLKRGSEWYALEKGSGQSILGAARLGMLDAYFKRELQRMPAMDISDVAYDRFLANGKPETSLSAEPGETIRLRVIDGSATTYFHLEFAGGPMTIVAADGLDVEPFTENRFLIGVAETYDVLVQVPGSGAYELRATAHDGSAYASVWIGSGERHPAPDVPKPNLYQILHHFSFKNIFSLTPAGSMGMPDREVEAGKFDKPGMMGMGSMHMGGMQGMGSMNHGPDHGKMKTGEMNHTSTKDAGDMSQDAPMPMEHPTSPTASMDHSGHSMSIPSSTSLTGKKYTTDFGFLAADVSASKNLAADGMDPRRPWPPYAKLRAIKPTAFSKDKPVRQIRLTLDGDMERYVWFLNNKPLSESDSILIREGEVARFIMINRTMMHHPMHLHGHFFRVINGQGDHAPLKHTVDVAPMSTTVIEFDVNEFGDWFFHCHLLYHMKSGMARVVHYEGFTLDPQLAEVRPKLYKDSWYFWGEADVLSNMTEGFLMLSNTRNMLTAEWEVGWQNVDDTEWEGIFTYDRSINRFFTILAGADLLGEGDEHDDTRGVLGFRYLLPLNLESRVWIDTEGGGRFNLEKSFELTPRLTLLGEAEYDTHDKWEGSVILSYMVHQYFSILGQWHSEYGFGGGLQIRF
jgi:FtsP/CotA-like multicopper oxidase with cupredoxin domain